ncbi:MAG: DUF4192 domain-containing protein [Streptosporangiaceae bacterium]
MSNTRILQGQPLLRLRSPGDILAAIPYLIGFHPEESLVVLTLGGDRRRVQMGGRIDLPEDPRHVRGVATQLAQTVSWRTSPDEAVVVGYGCAVRVTPAVDALRAALVARGVAVREALRAEEGRYWSYECGNPSCCPPEGTPFDVGSSAVAARATTEGLVAFSDRGALERSIGPLGGLARTVMRQATDRAEARLLTWLAECGEERELRRSMADQGLPLVHQALERHRDGPSLSDDETAWLGVLLKAVRVRDEAWACVDDERRPAHRALWTHVLRRVEPRYVPAPACLLAVAAWQDGEGALAGIALDRALQADPDYSMAHLLDKALRAGLPPSAAYPPMTPQQLAAAYDE